MRLPNQEPHDRTKPTTVLAVDDEHQTLSALGKALHDYGYHTHCVSTGAEALERLEDHKFDVVLCDLVMPKMSGLQLLDHTKNIRQQMIMIMMSGYADLAMACEALDRGANDFIVKPFSTLSVPISIERNLLLKQIEANRIIEQRNVVLLESIKALSAAMNAKEHGTAEHSERIAAVALMIADAIELPPVERSTLELAAYMHDIGKIGVRESLLLKPDRLSDSEWEEMKTHPDTGSKILSNIEELSDLAKIIRGHHERIDGTGYPDGLAGTDIPLLSRILAVADAFDAMTSDRPYRTRLGTDEAVERLKEAAGTQFDADIVTVFLRYMERQHREAA